MHCTRSPPIDRKHRFVQEIIRLAEDDNHGYSQRPPSGRWGPDYDCTSLIYQAAHNVGYNVGIGGDKIRFSGTMLKDFEKAGFQVLPFANVGISDLKIGDILLNLALHAEVYVGDDNSVGATSSENGGYVGEAGDQTGHEIEKHPVVTFDKGWDYILRPPDDDEHDIDDIDDIDDTEEGDEDMPTNYNMPPVNNMGWPQWTGSMQQVTPNGWPQGGNAYPQGNRWNGGYPQGNLGQMNGYSQANAGGYGQPNQQGFQQGYPQGNSQQSQLCCCSDFVYVTGIEEAKNLKGMPNCRGIAFHEDNGVMFILDFDQQGNVCNILPCNFQVCAEEYPQHLSPIMRNNQPINGQPMNNQMQSSGDMITREEFNELKEMLLNAQSNKTENESTNGARSSQQSNGNRLNARTN